MCDEEDDGDEFSWFNSLWFCLASMLQQGGDDTPRMLSGKYRRHISLAQPKVLRKSYSLVRNVGNRPRKNDSTMKN